MGSWRAHPIDTHACTHFERTNENQQLLTHFVLPLLNRSPSYKHIIYALFTIYGHKAELTTSLFSDTILVWEQHLQYRLNLNYTQTLTRKGLVLVLFG